MRHIGVARSPAVLLRREGDTQMGKGNNAQRKNAKKPKKSKAAKGKK